MGCSQVVCTLSQAAEGVTWLCSLMAAVGAALGGLVSSRLGPTTCFMLDSLSYLVAAWFAWRLLVRGCTAGHTPDS